MKHHTQPPSLHRTRHPSRLALTLSTLALAACAGLTSAPAQAQTPSDPDPPGAPPILGPGVNHPERRWKTFTTPHFEVHYYQGYEGFARYAVEIAEAGYERIAADLGVAPHARIPLVITEEEFWNGYAEPLRTRIVLDPRFALEPTIGLPRFILHEMTHILNFLAVENAQPFSRLINAAGLPAWFSEGLAQYEAEFWAPEMDRLLRLNALNRTLLTPAERNAFILLGSRGADGYNEGFAIVRHLFDTYGHDKLPRLLRTYRDQNVSFEQALEITFGKPMTVLEAEWRERLEHVTSAQIAHRSESIAAAEPVVPFREGRTWYQPAVSPDGKWLAYLSTGSYPTIRGHIYNIMPLKVASLARFEEWGRQEKARDAKAEKDQNEKKGEAKPAPTPDPSTIPGKVAGDVPTDPIPVPGASESPNPMPIPTSSPEAEPSPGPEFRLEDFESKIVDRLLDYRWSPDSRAIAYTTLKGDKYGNSTSRVLIQKLKLTGEGPNQKLENDGDPVELDPGFTTHSPAWSPDGKTLAVVRERKSGQQGNASDKHQDEIVFYDVATRQAGKTVLATIDWRQYRWLEYSPDGSQLVFEVFLPGQGQHLMRYELGTGLIEQLSNPDMAEADRQPVWAPDSKSLYFVSTRTGFADLWQYQIDSHELRRLSQLYTGIETPRLSPDGTQLYYARHHANGTSLERVAVPKLKPFDSFRSNPGEAIFEQQVSLNPPPSLAFEPKDYMPWFGLEVVVPVVGRDEKGDQLGFLAQFTDLLQTHSINVLALYGIASQRIGFSTAYINRFFDTSFGVEVGDSPVLSFTTDGSQYFIARDQHLSLFLNRPLFNAGSGDTFATEVERFASLEFNVSRQTNLTTQLDGLIEKQQLREGFNNSLAFNFSDNRSVGKNRGFRYNLGLSGASRFFGSQYEYVAANADWRQYIPTWGAQTLAYFVSAQGILGETRPALLGGPPLSNVLVLNFQNIIPLRGFRIAELTGPMMVAGSLEYRVPILNPIVTHFGDHYIENIHGAVFMDVGDAWYPSKRNPYPHIGVGLELRSEIILSRRNSFQLYVGAGKALLGASENYLTDRPVELYGGFANVF